MPPPLRVFEYEKIYYDKPGHDFKKKHWERLYKYNEQHKNKYYTLLGKGIQFGNYVGVIQVGNLTIEILPKAEKLYRKAPVDDKNFRDAEAGKWHDALLDMLAICNKLIVNKVDKARLNLKANSFLDIYLKLFLESVQSLLHQGLIKKYKKVAENRSALKGKLLFNRHLAFNIVHQERFFVEHTTYSSDNIYNRILLKALKIIPSISLKHAPHAHTLIAQFPELPDIEPTDDTFAKLRYDNRKTERYEEAMLIAKMIILNYRPDIKGGSQNVIAILFDMNKLWEEYVYQLLHRNAKGLNLHVAQQASAKFWLKGIAGSRSRKVRPDVVVRHKHTNRILIIDTKWKIPDNLEPSIDDLKQMFIYNLFWDCNESILLYPGMNNQLQGQYHSYPNTQEDMNGSCKAISRDIFDDYGKLSKTFCKELLVNFAG